MADKPTLTTSAGAPVARDPRGFAMKFYTEDGNWDLVGNNTPIFFIRDGIKFPDFIHSQKQDPYTNRQEPDNVWDCFSHSPEATHQFVILFSDRMLQARLFRYGDAHRYRLGINHIDMPVNSPKGVPGGAHNYGRDGAMPVHAPNGRVKNFEPNSFDGPVQTNKELYAGLAVSGTSGHYPQVPREVDDFKQAGDLYRLQPKDAQQRLVDNIAGSLAQVSRDDIIMRSIDHFRKADAELGRRLEEGVAARRAGRGRDG